MTLPQIRLPSSGLRGETSHRQAHHGRASRGRRLSNETSDAGVGPAREIIAVEYSSWCCAAVPSRAACVICDGSEAGRHGIGCHA